MEGELSIKIDYHKFENDCKWDGLKGYITNTELTGKQVIDSYNNLWKIEKAFRISKTDLKIRPIYHRLRERIEAHICISFVSYVLFKDLERILLLNSIFQLRRQSRQSIKCMRLLVTLPGNRIHPIRLKNNETQQQIIDELMQISKMGVFFGKQGCTIRNGSSTKWRDFPYSE